MRLYGSKDDDTDLSKETGFAIEFMYERSMHERFLADYFWKPSLRCLCNKSFKLTVTARGPLTKVI